MIIESYVQLSTVFKKIKLKNSVNDINRSVIHLFNLLFNSTIQITDESLNFCEKSISLTSQLNDFDFNQIAYIEEKISKIENDAKKMSLIYSLQLIYEDFL